MLPLLPFLHDFGSMDFAPVAATFCAAQTASVPPADDSCPPSPRFLPRAPYRIGSVQFSSVRFTWLMN